MADIDLLNYRLCFSVYKLLFCFQQEEIHIRSTGTERTILSGTYFGLGLNSNSTSGLPHVPPVFSSPKRYDSLLKMSYPCPAFSELFKASLDSNLSREFSQSELKLFEELKNFTGKLLLIYHVILFTHVSVCLFRL